MPTKKKKASSGSRKRSKSTSKTVESTLEEVYSQTGIPDADANSERLSDFCAEVASRFIEEWSQNEEISDVPPDVYDAVRFKIEETAGADMWRAQRSWLLEAIELSFQEAIRVARAPGAIDSPDEEKGIVSVTIHEPFLRIWREATEGVGYAAWGGDESLSDIKNLTTVLSILDNLAEVYGYSSIQRFYEKSIDDRFEPNTGSYWELSKIATKALKEANEGA